MKKIEALKSDTSLRLRQVELDIQLLLKEKEVLKNQLNTIEALEEDNSLE